MNTIIRHQWRGSIKTEVQDAAIESALAAVRERAEQARDNGCITALCVYRWKRMLFVYAESLQAMEQTYMLLLPLFPLLDTWPEADGEKALADMYPIYWHAVPDDCASWLQEREGEKTRIGRIAVLKPEKLFSYTYWHHAIVNEGLLRGDKYQFISLHENILFSYFEEPRTNVNLLGSDMESEVIAGWLQADPESHFDHEIIDTRSNFRVIEPLLLI